MMIVEHKVLAETHHVVSERGAEVRLSENHAGRTHRDRPRAQEKHQVACSSIAEAVGGHHDGSTCIHVPPPPPNQTVMVTVEGSNGLTTDEAWGAVWVEGTLTVAATTTDLASASYTITNATSGVYNDR